MLKITAAPVPNPSPAIAGPHRPTENRGEFSQLMADNKSRQQAMQAHTQSLAPASAQVQVQAPATAPALAATPSSTTTPASAPEPAAPTRSGQPSVDLADLAHPVDPAAAQPPRIEEATAGNTKANAAAYASPGIAAHVPAHIATHMSEALGKTPFVKPAKTDALPPDTRTVDATDPESDSLRPDPSEKSGAVDTAGAAAPAPPPDLAAWVAALTPAASPEASAETRAATTPARVGAKPADLDGAQVGAVTSTGLQVGLQAGLQIPGLAENPAAGAVAGEVRAVREQQAGAPADAKTNIATPRDTTINAATDAAASALQSGQPVLTQRSGFGSEFGSRPGTASSSDPSALVAHSAAWMAAPVATALPETLSVQVATATHAPEFRDALGVQVSLLARDGVQSAELHLNPAEMGPISVRIVMDGAQARVDFGADSAATRELIETGLPELATALRDAGFTLAGGGVSQHSQGSQDRSQDASQHPSDNRSGAGTNASRSARRIADSLADDHRAPVGLRMRVPNSAVDLYA